MWITQLAKSHQVIQLMRWPNETVLPVFWLDITHIRWLEPDTTVVISEASLQGKGATYQVTIQNLTTVALLDTRTNISVVSEKFFKSLPQKPKLSKVHMHKVMSASGANLGPMGSVTSIFN